jgi:hypothetical protein
MNFKEAGIIFDIPFMEPPDMYPIFEVELLENFAVNKNKSSIKITQIFHLDH